MIKKILIVDNNDEFRSTLKAYILSQILNAEVFEAISGEKGIKMALHENPNIVLMDYKLPQINGLEAAMIIKTSLSKCKIILMSMFELCKSKKELMHYGVYRFIIKNGFDAKLMPLIKKLLKESL